MPSAAKVDSPQVTKGDLRHRPVLTSKVDQEPEPAQRTGNVRLETDYIAVAFHIGLVAAAIACAISTPLRLETLYWAIAYYFFTGFCYTAGYHRLFAHRAYKAIAPLRLIFLVFGSANFLGSVTSWVRDHRAHHRNADTDKDPFNRHRGFWYAYMGSRLTKTSKIGTADMSDLQTDSAVLAQNNTYPFLAVATGLFLPASVAGLWDDFAGGLVYAGLWRVLIFLHIQYMVWALGHTFGHQPYSSGHTGRNNVLLSIISLGEGYLNFHREFPSDYRMGCFHYHLDATKYVLKLLGLLGFAYDFNRTPRDEIMKIRVQKQLAELEELKTTIEWGPTVEALPLWTEKQFQAALKEGRQLMILDSLVHDLEGFYENHPGGAEILRSKIGKDATIAFNGGVQRHSKAARNLAARMRIARLDKSAVNTLPKAIDE